jgi:hypothetical protein
LREAQARARGISFYSHFICYKQIRETQPLIGGGLILVGRFGPLVKDFQGRSGTNTEAMDFLQGKQGGRISGEVRLSFRGKRSTRRKSASRSLSIVGSY